MSLTNWLQFKGFKSVKRTKYFKLIGSPLILSALLIGSVILLSNLKGIPIDNMTRDICAVAEIPHYIGFFSQLGGLLWSATATICVFCGLIISNQPGENSMRLFFLFSAAFLIILGLDDVFLLHEEVIPSFGVSERSVYSIYFILMLIYLICFYSTISKTDYILLLIALFFFCVSIICNRFHFWILYEDGAKMGGIVSLLFYFYRTGTSSINTYQKQ